MNIKAATLAILLTTASTAQAQTDEAPTEALVPDSLRHTGGRLWMGGGGGLHSLNAQTADDVSTEGMKGGWTVTIGYDHSLSRGLMIGTGIRIAAYGQETTTSLTEETSNAIDKDGESFTHYLTITKLTETQKLTTLEIPLRLTHTADVSGRMTFEAAAELYAAIVMKDKYEVTGGHIATTGFYPQYNLHVDSDMPENGFYDITPSFSGKMGLRKAGIGVGASIGTAYDLTSAMAICFHIYGRYTLTDMSPKEKSAKQYDADCLRADGYNPTYASAIASRSCTGVHPLAVGATATLRFRIPNTGKATRGQSANTATAAKPKPIAHVAPPAQNATPTRTVREVNTELAAAADKIGGLSFTESGSLTPESVRAVARMADALVESPEYNVRVTALSPDGRQGINCAEAVARALEEAGVDEGRIRVASEMGGGKEIVTVEAYDF